MSTIYKVGSTYYANYVNAQGARVRGSLQTKDRETAKQALAIIENEVDRQRLTGDSPAIVPDTSLKEFSTPYLDWRKSEFPASQQRVQEAFDNHLIPEFGDIPLVDIAPFHVEQWKVKRKKAGAASSTIKKELDCLKRALNVAVKWELIPSHRIAHVSPPKITTSRPPRFFDKDELASIYDNATQYGALWKFMANTGIRRGEVMKAKREDVQGGVLQICSEGERRTKSGKWRPVPLSPGAIEALKELPDGYLAPRIHVNSLGRAFRNDCIRAEVRGSIHDLRHTFCSVLVMSGVDLRTVQELAGHKSFETTLRYAHLSETHLTNAMNLLDI